VKDNEVKPMKSAYSDATKKLKKSMNNKSVSIRRQKNSSSVSINYGNSSIEPSHINSVYQYFLKSIIQI